MLLWAGVITGLRHYQTMSLTWGIRADMQEFYRRIKIILVPSMVEEGFSRMILEAAANGIPAIANKVGGIPEALGDSGVLIPIESLDTVDLDHTADCYVRVIRRLMDNNNDYAVLRAKARQRAHNHARHKRKSCASSLTVMANNVILLKLRVSFFKQISNG